MESPTIRGFASERPTPVGNLGKLTLHGVPADVPYTFVLSRRVAKKLRPRKTPGEYRPIDKNRRSP